MRKSVRIVAALGLLAFVAVCRFGMSTPEPKQRVLAEQLLNQRIEQLLRGPEPLWRQ